MIAHSLRRVSATRGPGELIDVVVAECGIAVNPSRQGLIDATRRSNLPIRPLAEIKQGVERICGGKPEKPNFGDPPLAIVRWVDGTVLDAAWQVRSARS